MTDIIAKTRRIDGRLVTVRVHPDGREEVVNGNSVRPMTKDEIEAAAMARVPLAGTNWIPGQNGQF
mgnify:CR=1 FL=1